MYTTCSTCKNKTKKQLRTRYIVSGESGQFSVHGHGGPCAPFRFVFENHELGSACWFRYRAQNVAPSNGISHANIVHAHFIFVAGYLVQTAVALGQGRIDLSLYAREKFLPEKTESHDACDSKTFER